jgi:hypothetical protein
MRRTNVFIDVEDDVYDLVVSPHKKAKSFSRLMASLLQGYIEDEYIRSYGDGTLHDMRKASVDSLDSIIGTMTESLSNFGLFTDELEVSNNRGKELFNAKKSKQEDIVSKHVSDIKEESELVNKENNKLKEEVVNLKDDMRSLKRQNLEMMDILRKLTESGGIKEETKEELRTSQLDEIEKTSNSDVEDSLSNSTYMTSNLSVPEKQEVDNSEVENDITDEERNLMDGLLGGNLFGF